MKTLRVLVFGNRLADCDTIALRIAESLASMKGVEFIECDVAEDIEKYGPKILILDAAVGITKPIVLRGVENIERTKVYSMHDFDLSMMLGLLLKTGRISSITIIAVPADYDVKKGAKEVKAIISSLSAI